MNAADRRTLLVSAGAVCAAAALVFSLLQWLDPARPGWPGFTADYGAGGKGAQVTVGHVYPMSAASRAGVRPMDQVVAIGGTRLDRPDALEEATRKLRPGRSVQATLRRDGQERKVTLELEEPLRKPGILLNVLLNIGTGLAFLAVGAFVYWRRPGDTRAAIFCFMCGVFALLRLLLAGPTYTYAWSPFLNVVPVMLTGALSFLIFPALLHFCLVFPRERPMLQRHPKLLRWIYGLPAFSTLLLSALLLAAGVLQEETARGLGRRMGSAVSAVGRVVAANEARLLVPALLFLLLAALLLGRVWRRACRETGWKSAFLGRPGLVILHALVWPLLLGLVLRTAGLWLGVPWARGLSGAVIAILLAVEAGACAGAQMLLFPVAACVSLYRSYRGASLEEKQQIRWPLWGVITAVSGHFLSEPISLAIAGVLRLPPNSSAHAMFFYAGQYLEILSLVLLPLAFGFAILKHRLMEINLYIRKTVIYGAATGLLGAAYLLIIGGLGGMVSIWTGAQSQWVTIAATLLIAVAFVPVRNRVQGFVDQRFFRQRRDHAQALQTLAREVGQVRNEAALAEAAVEGIQGALGCRNLALLLRNADQRAYIAAASLGLPDDAAAALRLPLDAPAGPPGFATSVEIRRRDQLLGWLCLGPKLSEEEYDADDYSFLSAAADQIAIGLENQQLELQRREVDKAREIQQALLPSSLPKASGLDISGAWQPARIIGGDYYDVIELGDGRLAIMIADVSGKGLSAALLMSNLQAAVRALVYEPIGPAAMCERINRIVCGNVKLGRFITFFLAVVDPVERTLVYTNAGHNAPILCRRSGEIVRLEAGGTIFGFLRAAAYEQEELRLEPGDRLLLFTDGVSEAFDDNDDEFGDGRLIEILRDPAFQGADALRQAVLEAVTRFSGGNFHDDATLLAVEVCSTASGAAAA